MAPPAREICQVFVVSDGTGDTATAATKAGLLQFRAEWKLQTFRGIRSAAEAERVVSKARAAEALIVFTLVDEEVARSLREAATAQDVPIVDLLGPLIARVAEHLEAEPRSEPGILHGISDEYFRRVEAVEFAVRHGDGANAKTLFAADIVLTGVSRTSKTPLCMYLAQRGYRTGNVPSIPGFPPPAELLDLDPRKVFGLTIDPKVLLGVRQARVRAMGSSPYSTYVDPTAIVEEIQYARQLCRQRGWRLVDVSGRAVEENAARILQSLESGVVS